MYVCMYVYIYKSQRQLTLDPTKNIGGNDISNSTDCH